MHTDLINSLKVSDLNAQLKWTLTSMELTLSSIGKLDKQAKFLAAKRIEATIKKHLK
jgi:hypothetical protein